MNKTAVGAGAGMLTKPVPMKLFATWEVDRTPSNCIPRLCTLTLSRIIILRQLGTDLASISIAVKMQSSKRILRSIELTLPPNGLLDTSLELSFSLQYPHFLKRDGNRLHVLLQRRKRYKNRTMLGFKTLAEGAIRMDQVLQKQMDLELELNADSAGKDKGVGPVARIKVVGLSSMPVDQEHSKTDRDRDFSDEEDEFSSGEEEVADLSDSEPLRGGGGVGAGVVGGGKLPAHHGRHNLKQRFISLLKRFKVADTEGGRGAGLANNTEIQALFQELESLSCDEDSGGEQDTMSISSTPKPSLRPFFSSSRSLLDNNPHSSASANDAMMMMAACSVPNDDRNCSGSDGNADMCGTDYEAQSDPQTGSPPRGAGEKVLLVPPHGRLRSDPDTSIAESIEKKTKLFRTSTSGTKKKHSLSVGSDTVICSTPESITPRKSFLDTLSRLFPPDEPSLPDTVALITGSEPLSSALTSRLTATTTTAPSPLPPTSPLTAAPPPRIFQPASAAEVRAVIATLIARVTKHCNTCGKPATPVRLILIGGDTLVGWVLRPYVELLSGKPPDWVGFLRVYIVPLGSNISISRHVAATDPGYASLFAISVDPQQSTSGTSSTCASSTVDIHKTADDLATRIQRYLAGGPSAPCAQLPLAEAMLTCHQDELIIQQLQQATAVTSGIGTAQLSSTAQAPPSSAGAAQLFIPFVHEVRVGPADTTHSLSSVDLEDLMGVGPLSGGSIGSGPPSGGGIGAVVGVVGGGGTGAIGPPAVTPPSSPNVQVRESPWEPLELQLDYWQLPGAKSGEKSDKMTKSEGKTSFKGLFRGIQAAPGLNVTMQIANKEKKQKIMRLGKKKEKEEARAHCVESISRLICSAKASNAIPMRVLIDGAEWNGVKFFQLSNTWQTHVKHLSVALTGVPLATSEP